MGEYQKTCCKVLNPRQLCVLKGRPSERTFKSQPLIPSSSFFLSPFALCFIACPFKAGMDCVMFNHSQMTFPAPKAFGTGDRDT